MGVEPTIGRAFRPEEDEVPGRDAVVILGRTMWEQEFGSDPGVLGRSRPHQRRAVHRHRRGAGGIYRHGPLRPLGFLHPADDVAARHRRSEGCIARGARREESDAERTAEAWRFAGQAQSELTAIAGDLERAYPETNKNRRFFVRTELQARIAQSPPDAMLVAMLTTLALAVLLVACANVAGTVDEPGAGPRARDGAASRHRRRPRPADSPARDRKSADRPRRRRPRARRRLRRHDAVPSDRDSERSTHHARVRDGSARAPASAWSSPWRSALLFGLVPAIQATRTDLTGIMKAGDAWAAGAAAAGDAPCWSAAQVAVSVVLLAVAMFMYRGFGQQLANGPGYRMDHLLMMRFDTS